MQKENNYMIIIQCPCCSYYTISVDETQDIIIDFCEVCGWQYDWVAQKYPDRIIGPNHISLNDAKKYYKIFGVCCEGLRKNDWRDPLPEEFPENNS